MQSRAGLSGSLRRTTSRPSRAMDATVRYRLTSLVFVIFLDGRVPCVRCESVRRKSGHSAWIARHADLLVNGNRALPDVTSLVVTRSRTTDSSICLTKVHT